MVFNSTCISSKYTPSADDPYYKSCKEWSPKYIDGNYWEWNRDTVKTLLEVDRLLDIDLTNASYDLMLYNYENLGYIMLRLKFVLESGGEVKTHVEILNASGEFYALSLT